MVIRRDLYLKELTQKMHNGMIKVITGIRRCGKSYLLFNIFKDYLLSTGVKNKQIIEIILDDEKYALLRNPITLGEYIRSKTTNKKTKYYVLIDEIQYCGKIENPNLKDDFITFYNVLNGLLKNENIDTYVTGSNSKMLSSDILTEFRGRGDQIHVQPLSFSEYYSTKKKNVDFEDTFLEYATYGGLPKIISLKTDKQKSDYLKNLFEEVYIKDIVQHNNIKNEVGIKDLLNVLSSAIGSFTNPSKIENTFKNNIKTTYTAKTILNHINYLKDSFLINKANRYDIKGRKYIGANSKYYFSDVGLRNALLNFRQIEMPHLMENIIYNELILRGFNVDVGIIEINIKSKNGKSERKQLEVDFVANQGNKKFYIQSAYEISDKQKEEQEKKSLLNIDNSFKKIIITKERSKPHLEENGFLILGLKDFLLNDDSLEIN
ncbi:MAG: ATP-binding protein [Treponema sp.]